MGFVCLVDLLAAYTCSGPSAQLCVWFEELGLGLLGIGVGVFVVSFLNCLVFMQTAGTCSGPVPKASCTPFLSLSPSLSGFGLVPTGERTI